jgi:hypothetical protein
MTPDITASGILGILGAVLATIVTAFGVWRKKSSTQVALTEDRSQIGWIAGLDARMKQMQSQMDEMVTKERNTHDLHQECLRLSEKLSERVSRQDNELARMRRLLFAVRPELRDVFGGTSQPGDLEVLP